MSPILELSNVSKIYSSDENSVNALLNVSLKINSGDFLAIMGPSGSGKSTLMHLIGLLDTPTSGKMLLERRNVANLSEAEMAKIRNRTIGFVFQASNLIPRISVLDNVQLPLIYAGVGKEERNSRATEILSRLGLEKRLHHLPNQLSGGEQQRVAIARALITKPKIILADEPTGNLDSKNGAEIIKIFREIHKQKNTVVFVTHDAGIAQVAKKIIRLKDGQVVS